MLSITAAHGYGSVEISVEARPAGHIFFSVTSLAGWTVHPPDRHLQFGEFWSGLLSNATAPIVMGRLQGPRAIPGSAVASAGFIAVTAAAYYKWIFAASVGDELAFAVSDPRERSAGVAATWLSVASDREWPRPSPNRFLSWFWTDLTEAAHSAAGARAAVLGVDTVMLLNKWHEPGDELAVSESSFPSGIGATVEALRNTHGLRVGLHMHPDIVWPCDGGATAGLDCFSTGVGISKTVLRHPDALLQEGLSPTFRSGKFNVPSEDVAFYWGHDPGHWPDVSPDEVASVAHNGNPVPCGQGSCNPHDWPSNAWAPDLNLSSARWSPVGRYRGGFSIAFSGDSSSRGETPWWRGLDDITTGLTVGIVVHAPITGAPLSSSNDASNAVRTLCSRNGSWSLGVTPAGLPRLDVYTTLGQVSVIGEKTDAIKPGTVRMIKGTYNATSGSAKLFVDGRLAAAAPKPLPGGKLLSSEDSSAPRGSAAVGTGLVVGAGFAGSIEELYIKNVSTENRPGYVYADSNRVAGTFLLDLDTDAGRALFAARVAAVTRLANFSAVQYDGFEKLQLIAALDFAHSAKTATSGLFRGPPTPDWYHYQGWPLRVGQGILSGIAAAHEKMPSAGPAVECSFVAPGSGSGRPDMAPYVDEREDRNASLDPNGFVLLGLQWHSKMLQRVEITGIAVNPYNTQLDRLETLVELDYWFGGLVATGVAPQPQGNFEAGRFDAAVGEWIRLYRRLGHLQEHLVQTLTQVFLISSLCFSSFRFILSLTIHENPLLPKSSCETARMNKVDPSTHARKHCRLQCRYDTMCCHVQGDCEWDVCEDSITTRFAGGSLQRSPPTGLYIGSSRVVTVGMALVCIVVISAAF